MRTVTLKPGHAKPLWQGHPWVFAASIAKADEGTTDWVRVVDSDGRAVGHGLWSGQSAIRVRLVTERDEGQDVFVHEVLTERIKRAVALRSTLFPDPERTNAYRLVHAEADGVPGLIVDRYEDALVAQWATGPIHARRELLSQVLLEATGARGLISRPAGHEEREGIPEAELGFAAGARVPEELEIRELGMCMLVRPHHGQKTGHYVDQRENRQLVAELCGGRTVLDLFSGGGGFALHALRAGAVRARAVDSARQCAELIEANAVRNQLGASLDVVRADVTTQLAAEKEAGSTYGMVVVDPPNLIPTGNARARAIKPWRELLVRSFTRVEPAGFLASFSCTPRLDAPALLDLMRSASRDCRRSFRVLRELSAGPDHPVLPGAPTSRYLSGFLVQVRPW